MCFDSESSVWITGDKSREHAHDLRSKVDGLLIGKNTALVDNPQLTVREVLGNNPKRIILDTNRLLPLDLKIFNDSQAETIVLCSNHKFENNQTSFCRFLTVNESRGLLEPLDILRKLGEEGITSVLIEGGQKVHKSFIDANLIDEFYIYTSNKILDNAILNNPFKIDENWDLKDEIYLEEDILTIVKNKKLCLQES